MLDMLDVAIGLAFLYLIMSLVATAGAEIVEAMLQYRARDLEHGIREMLNDADLAKKLYDHPLVASLYKGGYKGHPKVWRWTYKWVWWKWRLPSYIPARNFALAMMDLVLEPGSGGSPIVASGMTGATPAPADSTAPMVDPFLLVDHGDSATAKNAIVMLVGAAGRDAAMARQNIEMWFNSSMDRVSGWYKRRTQWFLLFAGLIAAVIMNVDSISIARQLSTNKAMRDSAVAAATEWSKANAQFTAQTATIDPATPAGQAVKKKINDFNDQYAAATKQLEKAGLPIGWDRTWCAYWSDPAVTPSDYMLKLLGLFITACAVSLGAPFWFDTLNKFIVVRSTVKPEEKSHTSAPK